MYRIRGLYFVQKSFNITLRIVFIMGSWLSLYRGKFWYAYYGYDRFFHFFEEYWTTRGIEKVQSVLNYMLNEVWRLWLEPINLNVPLQQNTKHYEIEMKCRLSYNLFFTKSYNFLRFFSLVILFTTYNSYFLFLHFSLNSKTVKLVRSDHSIFWKNNFLNLSK